MPLNRKYVVLRSGAFSTSEFIQGHLHALKFMKNRIAGMQKYAYLFHSDRFEVP